MLRSLSEASTCEPELIAAAADKCNFTAQNCVDDFSGVACSYVELEFCSLGGSGVALGAVSAVLLLVLISGLGSTADVFFIPAMMTQAFSVWRGDRRSGAQVLQAWNSQVISFMRSVGPWWDTRRHRHAVFSQRCGPWFS